MRSRQLPRLVYRVSTCATIADELRAPLAVADGFVAVALVGRDKISTAPIVRLERTACPLSRRPRVYRGTGTWLDPLGAAAALI